MALGLRAGDTFRSLRTRNFRLFFVGQLISQTGTWMQFVSVIWVVLRLTDDGVAIGFVTAAQFLPVLILGAWSGVLSDRVDRHRLVLTTQCSFAVLAATYTMLAFTDRLTLPYIYVLSVMMGIVNALENPARRALVVEMVSERDVPNAVGLNSALITGSRVVGPAIAGFFISTVGVEWNFVTNAVSYVAVVAALAAIDRSSLRSPPPVPRAKRQLRDGLQYIWAQPDLRLPLILFAVIGTLAFEFQVTLPLLAERSLGGGANTFTLLYSLMSFGSVAGALAVARRSDVDTRVLAKTSLGLALSMTALAAAPTRLLAFVAVLPVGFAMVYLISGINTIIQLRADPAMRGRALAISAVVFLGSTPIGGPIAGAVSELFGASVGILLGAVASAAVAVWVLRQQTARDLADAVTPIGAS